ncbi:Hypothetical_protein [Hexamita inflata]|uniref:Hypothetical_protein n=1 Tax=Hexamita inflata TaxID=28002 RepID=A0AA86R0K6_9EUKA|nr:Hypothetical protein HINF_LOCUS55063 [Hexamita inflata]
MNQDQFELSAVSEAKQNQNGGLRAQASRSNMMSPQQTNTASKQDDPLVRVLNSQLAQLNTRYDAAKQNIQSLISTVRQVKQERDDKIQILTTDFNTEIEQLNEQIQVQKRQLLQDQDDFSSNRSEQMRLKQEIKQLKAQIQKLDHELSQAQSAIQHHHVIDAEHAQKLQSQQRVYENQIQDVKHQLAQANIELQSTEENLESAQEQFKREHQQSEQSRTTIQKIKEQLKAQLDEAQSLQLQTEQQNEQIKQKSAALQKLNTELIVTKQNLQNLQHSSETEISALKTFITELKTQKDAQALKSAEEMKHHQEESEKKNTIQTSEIQQFKVKTEQLTAELSKITAELNLKSSNLQQVTGQLSKTEAKLTKLEENTVDKNIYTQINSERTVLLEKLAEIQNDNSSMHVKIQELQNHLEVTKEAQLQLEEENYDKQAKIDEITEHLQRSNNELEKIENELVVIREQSKMQQSTLQQQSCENSDLKEQIAQLEEELYQNKVQITTKSQMLNEVTEDNQDTQLEMMETFNSIVNLMKKKKQRSFDNKLYPAVIEATENVELLRVAPIQYQSDNITGSEMNIVTIEGGLELTQIINQLLAQIALYETELQDIQLLNEQISSKNEHIFQIGLRKQKELVEYKLKQAELEAEVQKLQDYVQKSTSISENNLQVQEQQVEQINQKNSKIEQLEDMVEALNKQLEDFKLLYENIQNKMQNDNQVKTQQIEALFEENKSIELKNRELLEVKTQLKYTVQSLEDKLQTKIEQFTNASEKIAKLENAIESKSSDFKQEEKQLSQAIQAKQSEILTITQESNQKITQLSSQLSESQFLAQKLQQELEAKQQTIKSYERASEEKFKEISGLKDVLKEADTHYQQLEYKYAQSKQAMQMLEQQLATQQNDTQKQAEELSKTIQEIVGDQEIRSRDSNVQDQLQVYKQKFLSADVQKHDLEVQIKKLKAENKELQEQIEILNDRPEVTIVNQQPDNQLIIRKHEQHCSALNEKIQQLEDSNKEITKQKQALETQNKQLAKKIQELIGDKFQFEQTANLSIAELQQQNEQLKQELQKQINIKAVLEEKIRQHE